MYSAGSEKFNVVSVELSRILAIKVRASPVVPLRISQKENYHRTMSGRELVEVFLWLRYGRWI